MMSVCSPSASIATQRGAEPGGAARDARTSSASDQATNSSAADEPGVDAELGVGRLAGLDARDAVRAAVEPALPSPNPCGWWSTVSIAVAQAPPVARGARVLEPARADGRAGAAPGAAWARW